MKLNTARVWLGGVAGGVVWIAWGFVVGMRQAPLYEAIQKQGLFLKEPRYSLFTPLWILLIFVMSILIARLYAWARATAGPGPKTALKIGMIVGFCAGVPGNFGQAAWSPVPTMLPLGYVGRLDPGRAGSGFLIQGVETRLAASSFASPQTEQAPSPHNLLCRFH